MALTSFDGTFSFKQEEMARMGGFHEVSQMTAAQWEEFQNSPFMKSMRKAEEVCNEKTIVRDAERAKRDPEFAPQDGDWTAEKSFQYDKGANYYRMLGVDDLASLQEVKQAYKKLSLIYHPDKTAGMTQKEKEEHNAIFIELKNAYKTLSDPPTRRQYDRERDRDFAVMEVNGWKPKHKRGFDATDVLKKLQDEQKNPGKTVDIQLQCRLEKFLWGGHKGHKRERRLKDFVGFTTEEKTFRLDVPPLAPEPLVLEFKHAGDHQEEARPDTLRFELRAKPHELAERQGDDLVLRRPVALQPDAHAQPYLSGQVEPVRGLRLVFWGRNPLFRATGSGRGSADFAVRGLGLGPEGALKFSARLGAVQDPEQMVVRLRQLQTGAEMALRLPRTATVADAQQRARTLLDFLGSQGVRLMRAQQGQHQPLPEDQPLGAQRSFDCGGTVWENVPLPYDAACKLLSCVCGLAETEQFEANLVEAYGLPGRTEQQDRVLELWRDVCAVLPDFGFDETVEALKAGVQQALQELKGDKETELLRARTQALVLGFDPDAFEQRGTANRPRGLAQHPLMLGRAAARLAEEPCCELELAPLGEPLRLYTQPACWLRFFSNQGQPAKPGPGLARPRLAFACAVSCPTGVKRAGREEWLQLAEELCPLVEASLPLLLRASRAVLPRSLAAAPAPGGPEQDPDCRVLAPGEEPEEESAAESEDEPEEQQQEDEEDEDDDDDGGGGFFDFDDIEEVQAKKKRKKEQEEAQRRRREAKRAVRRLLRQEWRALERRCAAHERAPPVAGAPPWRKLGDRAAAVGDMFLAAGYFSRELEGLEGEEAAGVLCARSGCLSAVGHFGAAADDARRAVELRPGWGEAWGRLGLAASRLGADAEAEARQALFRAVQHAPAGPAADELFRAVREGTRSAEAAEAELAAGAAALAAGDGGLAVAHYTQGLAALPELPEGEAGEQAPLRHLCARFLANRCLAFMRLRCWDCAVADGLQAAACAPSRPKSHLRLGAALLGVGQHERAYQSFARGLRLSPEDAELRRGRDCCLGLLPLWRSVPAMARLRTRYSMDLRRPKASSKVYVMSDLHFDHKKNDEWVHFIDEFMFQEDVLIVAGNVADTLKSLVRALRALKLKFRRVFFTPGNHEMWIHPSEVKRFPDSIAKFHAIMEACDELGVDVFPAPIAEDCFIVPLFSWYNADYDESDPFPDPKLSFDAHCRWPMKPDQEVWRYFLELNRIHLQLPYEGTVVSFSHFLPRQGLPFDRAVPKIAKVMGCEELDEQIRCASLKSKLHVFGHSRKKHARMDEGVMYICHFLGYENDHTDKEPLMCVYNGQSTCNRTVPIDKS